MRLMIMVLACFLALVNSCRWEGDMSETMGVDQVTSISCRYLDSSVPPQYHRSYTMTVTPATLEIVVDSYGDILAKQTTAYSDQQFQLLLREMRRLGIEGKREDSSGEPCLGGAGWALSLSGKEGLLLTGEAKRCGGRIYSTDLAGDIEGFLHLLEDQVPGFSTLMETGG